LRSGAGQVFWQPSRREDQKTHQYVKSGMK
jgi:hypothetical protein